jgi:uncharacterized protein YggE
MERTITVSGSASVSVAPDCARLQFGVQVEGVNAQDALRRSNEAMHAILDAVRARGVAPGDLNTNGPNLWPGERGYTGGNDVTVLVRDVASLGSLIDAVAESSGPNLTMHGVAFSVLDPEPHLVDARRRAVAAATEVAGQIAAAAGCALGEVLTIGEGGGGGGVPVFARADMAGFKATPVEAGSQDVRADVTVTFRLVDAG